MTKVVFVGEIYHADLSIGGGPIIPPAQPPGQPPGIWGPPGPWPTPPIHIPGQPPQPPLGIWGPPGPWPTPPIAPGGQPPGIWGPTDPRPTLPIYIPAQPILPDSGDPSKAHIVVYVPGSGAVSFTVDLTQLPEPVPPAEATPKA